MKQVVINIHHNIEHNLGLIHGKDWEQVLFVHDEVEIVCKPQYTQLIKEQAMIAFPQSGEFFGFLCPVEGDARVGTTWYDVH